MLMDSFSGLLTSQTQCSEAREDTTSMLSNKKYLMIFYKFFTESNMYLISGSNHRTGNNKEQWQT